MKYTTDHAKAQVLADRLENVFNEDPNNNFDSEHFDHINQQIESDAISKLYKPREKLAKKFTMRDLTKSRTLRDYLKKHLYNSINLWSALLSNTLAFS